MTSTSEPGKGSTSSMPLPLPVVTDEMVQAISDEPSTARGLRVLLVDDHIVNRTVARLVLERLGHDVTLAESGAEAVLAVQRARYDAVLMDIEMPDMDGYDTSRAIRAYEASRGTRVPIFALTANAVSSERAQNADLDGHLTKPIDTGKLSAALSSLARTRRSDGAA